LWLVTGSPVAGASDRSPFGGADSRSLGVKLHSRESSDRRRDTLSGFWKVTSTMMGSAWGGEGKERKKERKRKKEREKERERTPHSFRSIKMFVLLLL